MFQHCRKNFRLPLITMLALTLLSTQPGCITLAALMGVKSSSPTLDTRMLEAQGYSLPPGGMPTAVEPDEQGRPRVVLEIRDKDDKRHVESIPLPEDGALFIQDVVKQAKLNEHFGGLHISIMRPTTGGAPPIRLQVRTDRDGKVAQLGTNYGLFNGDHIVVVESNESAIERFLKSQFSL